MSGKKNIPTKNYKLISAYIRLNQSQHEEDIQNQIFDRKLKGFHLFCIVLFGVFLVDGQLPSNRIPAKILAVKVLNSQSNILSTTFKGKTLAKSVSTPTRILISTNKGIFITNEITGYEKTGTKVEILKTPMFNVNKLLFFKERKTYVRCWINFSGNFIFWPLLAFLLSLVCLVTKQFYGSTTLAVIAILNFVPFFTIVYLDLVY